MKTTVVTASIALLTGYFVGSYITQKTNKQEKQIEVRYKTVVKTEYVKAEKQQQQEKIIIKYRENGTVAQKTEVRTVAQTQQQTAQQTSTNLEEQKETETKVAGFERNWILGVSAPQDSLPDARTYKVLGGYRLSSLFGVYATASVKLDEFTIGGMVFL
jgi:hypothetical protein